MALLSEYALTPDVFDCASYSHEDVCSAHIQYLKDILMEEALVRDLRNGGWGRYLASPVRSWHRRTKELLKKLGKQNRLASSVPFLPAEPIDDAQWCKEALGSHNADALTGIIATATVATAAKPSPIIGRVDRLSSSAWWSDRSPSIRLRRELSAYTDALRLIARHANSLMLIDPHLDPTRRGYGKTLNLLMLCEGRAPAPLIEVHRVCYQGSGRNRTFPNPDEWQSRFRNAWQGALHSAGLAVEVFIWDDMHDRYLISDLIGIELGNGFDTSGKADEMTTWSRIGRADRDDVQREFDPASYRHALKHRFIIA